MFKSNEGSPLSLEEKVEVFGSALIAWSPIFGAFALVGFAIWGLSKLISLF